MTSKNMMRRHATRCSLAFLLLVSWRAVPAQVHPLVTIDAMSEVGANGYALVPLIDAVASEMENLATALSTKPDYPTSELKALRAKLPNKTVVHARYTWKDKAGLDHAKTYYGLSGKELDELIPEEMSVGRQGGKVRTRARFPDFDSRLVDVPDVDASGKPVSRYLDAELKVARTLERDIGFKNVEPGGRLDIQVSQAPCPSCTKVLNDLATLDPVSPMVVKVHYLAANPDRLPHTLSAQFHDRRMTAVKDTVSPSRIKAAQAMASGQIDAAGCL